MKALRHIILIGLPGVLSITLLFTSCSSPEQLAEPWISLPVSQWPDMALTNEVIFDDTTFTDLANGFLVRYEEDTFAITCKHIFLVFKYQLGYQKVHLGDDFQSWWMYPENKPELKFKLGKLLNDNPAEEIGEFNTLKNRDWLVFEVDQVPKELHVFSISESNPFSGESIYSFGWGDEQTDTSHPNLIKMEFIKSAGYHFYTQTLTENVKDNGRSGSVVFNNMGLTIGLISGAEGKLGVMGSTSYLTEVIFKSNKK